ncbi:MAG: DUF4340 domain-containing protein [Chitinophagaceae bacterium]|nr:DUF4340 domain-containing protein [Chitinophagaceae bacterium]
MKKTLIYVAVLLLLCVLAYVFVFKGDSSPFGSDETNFTVKDTAAITTIFLSNPQGQKVKLSRGPKEWTLNDSMVARKDAVEFLLQAMHDQKPEQPVSMSYHDAVVTDMSVNNTKVELYSGDKNTHTFYVGRNPGTNNCTYMLKEGAKRPYIVKLPLQNTFVGVRYFCSVSDWRERRILYGYSDIEQIKLEYKDSVQYSFTLDVKPEGKTVTGSGQMDQPLNLKRVDSYLGFWESIYCTGYENSNFLKDSILKHGRQLATINIKRKESKPQTLTLYFRPPDKGTKAILKIDGESYDFDTFFGWLNHHDFILISRKNAEKMLRSYPEFFQQ